MINIPQFEAKVVRKPEKKDTKYGPVCNFRIRQIDPGKSSVFLNVATFDKALIKKFEKLGEGMVVKLAGGLTYREWTPEAKGKSKPQRRSMYSLIASSVEIVPEAAVAS